MKVIVAYDSVYGNTALVAQAIGGQAREEGHATEMIPLHEERAHPPEGDLLFLGGPTHLKGETFRVDRFLRHLGRSHWSVHPIVAFDTFGPVSEDPSERRRQRPWTEPGAAGAAQELARRLGLLVYPGSLRCRVVGLRGPLAPEALTIARGFAHEVLYTVGHPGTGMIPRAVPPGPSVVIEPELVAP